jgi:hypothetical protein
MRNSLTILILIYSLNYLNITLHTSDHFSSKMLKYKAGERGAMVEWRPGSLAAWVKAVSLDPPVSLLTECAAYIGIKAVRDLKRALSNRQMWKEIPGPILHRRRVLGVLIPLSIALG